MIAKHVIFRSYLKSIKRWNTIQNLSRIVQKHVMVRIEQLNSQRGVVRTFHKGLGEVRVFVRMSAKKGLAWGFALLQASVEIEARDVDMQFSTQLGVSSAIDGVHNIFRRPRIGYFVTPPKEPSSEGESVHGLYYEQRETELFPPRRSQRFVRLRGCHSTAVIKHMIEQGDGRHQNQTVHGMERRKQERRVGAQGESDQHSRPMPRSQFE